MPLGTAWNGLFAVFVEFLPKTVNKEEQKSTCNPFRHEWNLKSMEHYKYFTRYEYCYSARLIKSYTKDIYNIIK